MASSRNVCRLCRSARVARSVQTVHTSAQFRNYASAAAARVTTPAPTPTQIQGTGAPIQRHHPLTPPSFHRAAARNTQIFRQYVNTILTSPVMLVFQHTNLKATEWMALRRELLFALRKVDQKLEAEGRKTVDLAEMIKIQIINAGVFAAAIRVVEYWDPKAHKSTKLDGTDPRTDTSKTVDVEERYSHYGSQEAWDATIQYKGQAELSPLLTGPCAILSIPTVSVPHLQAAMSILSPKAPTFKAPPRKQNPGLYEANVQSAIQKLLLVGARIEGSVFDLEGTRWVGGIQGGMDGLRAQLVQMLQSAGGAGVTNALESATRSLYFTMESRRLDMEEKEKGPGTESSESKE